MSLLCHPTHVTLNWVSAFSSLGNKEVTAAPTSQLIKWGHELWQAEDSVWHILRHWWLKLVLCFVLLFVFKCSENSSLVDLMNFIKYRLHFRASICILKNYLSDSKDGTNIFGKWQMKSISNNEIIKYLCNKKTINNRVPIKKSCQVWW